MYIIMYISFINMYIRMYMFIMENAKLEEFNHWWLKAKVDPQLALPFKRDAYFEVEKHLPKRFISSLTGLRRVGKSTIMYQLIQKLLEDGADPPDILFFSFDDTTATIGEVIDAYKVLHKRDFRSDRSYIFLDEIQKCTGWQNDLKKYYDLYPYLKFVISGSESLFIKKKTKEMLAGRIFEFSITTFSFSEYLRFKDVKQSELKYETKIMPFFIDFAEKGGFPETFLLDNERDIKEYIRNLVVDKIVYKDIPKMFKIEDTDFLKTLLELIAVNPGAYIDYQSIGQQFGKDRRVVKSYISYLENSFLVRLLGNYRKGRAATLRKNKRAYVTDNAISYLYKDKIDERFFGRMVENLVINSISAKSFWKNGHEIDIINNGIPIEVKYQQDITETDMGPLTDFMEKFGVDEALLLTKKDEKSVKTTSGRIRLILVWKWLLSERPSYPLEARKNTPNPKSLLKLKGLIKNKKPVKWSEEIDETLYGEKP